MDCGVFMFSRVENNTANGLRAGLRQWFAGKLGRRLYRVEKYQAGQVLANLFGYHIVQLGVLGKNDLLGESRIHHRVVANIDPDLPETESSAMSCHPAALPFATSSIDVVVLPHVLEFEHDPHAVLREVERVLIGEGHVVIIGFNPLSVWGLYHLALMWGKQPPWCGRFHRLGRVVDWLHVLGFDNTVSRYFFFHTPLRISALAPTVFLEKQSAYRWPYCGGAYILVAKKRVLTLTPILKLHRKRQKVLAGGVVRPSTRNPHDD